MVKMGSARAAGSRGRCALRTSLCFLRIEAADKMLIYSSASAGIPDAGLISKPEKRAVRLVKAFIV